MSVFRNDKTIKTSETADKVVLIGSGTQPLFKNNLSGADIAQLALAPSTKDVLDFVLKSIQQRGFDKNKNYTEKEMSVFVDAVYDDLMEKVGGILNRVNQ